MIYLLRHTQPDIESGICYGVSDIGLHSDFDSFHLSQVLASLEGIKIDRVCSSPLKRCSLLADRVCSFLGLDLYDKDILLREMNFGDWELMSWDNIFNSERGKEWFDNFISCSTPSGESFEDLISRADKFLSSLHLVEGENILLVTHAGFIRAAMVAAGNIERSKAFDCMVGYGEITKL